MVKSGLVVLTVWVAVVLALAGGNACAEEPDALAGWILKAVDRPVGLVHLP